MDTFISRAGCIVVVALIAAGLSAASTESTSQEPPAPETSEKFDRRIGQLIEQLGDEDFFVRERAQNELATYSFEVFDQLNAATTHKDLEIATRAQYLLRLMRVQWTRKDDPPEVKQLLTDYEIQNASNKLARMRALAALADGKGAAALCRLIRYEQSPVLSKRAALELIQVGSPSPELIETAQKALAGSRRTAAIWLRNYLRRVDQPEAIMADWAKLVEAEHELLRRSPERSNTEIVGELVRLQIAWLKQAGRNDRAVAAMSRLVDLESGEPHALAQLTQWLIAEEAWPVVEELAGRFSDVFAEHAYLLYFQAQARAAAGNAQGAEEVAGQALAVSPGGSDAAMDAHLAIASLLQHRGLFHWAKREYRHVIDTNAGSGFSQDALRWLAEMLHDQEENHEAAEALAELEQIGGGPNEPNDKKIGGQVSCTLGEIRSRMYYFYACHAKSENGAAKQREYLDKALAADDTDVDVLIACYRLPDPTPEYRKKILELIERSAARFRREIANEPDSATPYNQFAWLIGNTEGDFDEALRFSKRSLHLRPNTGGYLDTLAHVYFGMGDYENAVKTQTKAIEHEPHSKLIRTKLELFEKKLQEEQQQK